jgi:hypothetical protein
VYNTHISITRLDLFGIGVKSGTSQFLHRILINTKDNREADLLSRKKILDTEWELCDDAYEKIKHKLGSHHFLEIPKLLRFSAFLNDLKNDTKDYL